MDESIAFFTDQLKSKGIRPSFQRIKVLEYLNRNGGHPTVEEIFSALSPVIPSLSKGTIYNTVHTFVEAGLVRVVEIDDAQMRYDITLNDHGHFLCAACGTIYNFPVRIDPVSLKGLNQFKITQKNIYFKGFCPNCLENPHTIKEQIE
jgi:Fur family peroxide stress response transcriptional regulator